MFIKATIIAEVTQDGQFAYRHNLDEVSDFDFQVGIHDFLHQILSENGILNKEIRLEKFTNDDS